MIKYIKYKNIDTEAWDKCIKASINKDVTALSGYLDIACKKWDALILDDYKAVMPLPRTNSILFNNYYTNFLAPQLGVYGNGITYNVFFNFVKMLKNKSYGVNYKFNKYNYYEEFDIKLEQKIAYEFDVYSKNNIFINSKYYNRKRISNNEIVKFIKSNNIIANVNMNNFEADLLKPVLAYALRRGIAYSYTAYDKHNNLVGFAFFIKSFTKDKLIFTAIKEKNRINEVFEFLLNNHLKVCRRNIGIDLGYSDTYFENLFKLFNAKRYIVYAINKN